MSGDISLLDNVRNGLWQAHVLGGLKLILFFPSYIVQSLQSTVTENHLLDMLQERSSKMQKLRVQRLQDWNRSFYSPLRTVFALLASREQSGFKRPFRYYCRYLKECVNAELHLRNPLKFANGYRIDNCIAIFILFTIASRIRQKYGHRTATKISLFYEFANLLHLAKSIYDICLEGKVKSINQWC